MKSSAALRWCRERSYTDILIAASYVVLGATLLLTRLAKLGHSLWLDEAVFVETYVREGPRTIMAGGLNHELYALVDWGTASIFGESIVAFRLWSAVPFVIGASIVAAWLHRRVDPLSGVLFLFLATVSPLLLDVSRQARGYGSAFFFMGILVVAALEAVDSGGRWLVPTMCVAGALGAWTLPQFVFAFVAIGLVVTWRASTRLTFAAGMLLSLAAIVVWYVPNSDQIRAASQNPAGTLQITTAWLVTAPVDQILLPALVWIEGTTLAPSIGWLPFVLLAAAVMAASPLLRRWNPALVLLAGPVATVVALWIVGAYVAPRFLSFLLVPLFVLLATGASAVLAAIPRRRALGRAALCLVAIPALVVHFAQIAPDLVRLPREANRDAAELIETHTPGSTPVLAQVKDPQGLEFYLSRPLRLLRTADVIPRVCGARFPLVYVRQPQAITLVDVPCLRRGGVQHHRFAQYTRGGKIDVWFVPPR